MRYKQNNSNKVFLRINNAANWGRIILGVLTGGVSEVGIGIAQSSKGVKMSGKQADDDDADEDMPDQYVADNADKDKDKPETSYTKYIVLGILVIVLIIILVLNKKKK
ncbi:MAG: hypothetical protein LBG80_19050 [Bacteroidales bacterium]|jgi:hypothetical protein|nr:hypothetical protein [Bacteroidales bacterium]